MLNLRKISFHQFTAVFLCTLFQVFPVDLCEQAERSLEDRDLAYFLHSDPQFQAYIRDMLWAQDYALENREQMMDAVLGVVADVVGRPVAEARRINCHHNYTERELHGGRPFWITRKGAIRARAGDAGVVPGSMGTNTFVVSGKGNPDAYHSAAHGAGRRYGRKAAKRSFTTVEFERAMVGRMWQRSKAKELLDESPMAYKDIDVVMEAQRDLVDVVHTIRQVVCVKG